MNSARNFSLLVAAFVIILIMGVLHFIAGAFYFYWTLGWFDYLMHFLGGLGGGLVVAWFVSDRNLSTTQTVVIVFCSVMLVGVVWEIFEKVNDIAQSTEGYALDTTHDLLMDALGSLVAGFFGANKLQNNGN